MDIALSHFKKKIFWPYFKTASALQIIIYIYKGEVYVPGWKVAKPVTRNTFQPISSFDPLKHLFIKNKYMLLIKMQT